MLRDVWLLFTFQAVKVIQRAAYNAEQVRGGAFSIVLNPVLAPGTQAYLRCFSATDLAGLRRHVRTVLMFYHRAFPWPFDFGMSGKVIPRGRWSPGPFVLSAFRAFSFS